MNLKKIKVTKKAVFSVLLASIGLSIVGCGGPKRVVFEVTGNIQRPADISESDYQRLLPILTKTDIECKAEITSKEGNLVESRTQKAKISKSGNFSTKLEFDIDDFSNFISIKSKSDKLLMFEQKIISDNLKNIRKTICSEGDINKDGYDFMCVVKFSVSPKLSEQLITYLDIRDSLTKADDKSFCNVYSSARNKVNSLQADLQEIALSDVSDMYYEFVDRMRKRMGEIEKKINSRDCSDKGEVDTISTYFCLPEDIIKRGRILGQFCLSLQLYEEGVGLLKRGQSIKALDKFRKAVEIKPDFADPYISIGDIYIDEKRYEDAAEVYRTALRYSETPAVYAKLADAYALMKKYELSDEALRRAIDLAGESADHTLFYKRALALKYLQKWDQASEPAKRAVDMIARSEEIKYDRNLQKLFAKYLTLLGEIYFQLGRIAEATKVLEDATKEDPFNAEAYYLLAQLFSNPENKSDMKKAKGFFEKLFTLDSEFKQNGEAWLKYASLLEMLQEDESQIASAYEKAVRFSPDNPRAYLKIAKIYENKKGYEKTAEEMYKKAYETAKDSNEKSQNLQYYIDFLFKRGNYSLAKRIMDDYISKNPADKEAKQRYNEALLMLYNINPANLKKLGIPQPVLDEIYSAFSSVDPQISEEIVQSVGIRREFFEKLDPYKKFAVIIFYMDYIYGKTGKGVEIQKAEKYKSIFPSLTPKTIQVISRFSSDKLGINLTM